MSKGIIKADQIGIGDVLRLHRLVVPPNQREYSWEEEHVNDLVQDFTTALDEKPTYFLGAIVVTQGESGSESEYPEVSDGQQRLATCTILLSGIRDYFIEQKDEELAVSIENDFLFTYDRESRSKVARLTLNVDDRDFFLKKVLQRPSAKRDALEPKKDSHRKMATAMAIAARHVQEIIKPFREDRRADVLNKWIHFIQEQAQVILLKVPDDLDAFVMFETMNGRGLRTSQADLVKNYLFKKTARQLAAAQQKWGAMTGVLESLGEEEITVTYLRHLLQTMHGPTKEREVLDKVKKENNSQPKAMNFLEDLADSANDYAAILNPAHPKWSSYGTTTRRSIETITRHLRVEQIRPLMLAVARRFSPKEAEKAFRLFVSWSVRFLIVGGRGGLLDRNYATHAQDVGLDRITTAKELAKSMSDVVPSDGTFLPVFAEARVSQNHLARYYLRALEIKVTGQPEPELVPNEDPAIITLEHVLPENPGDNYPDVTSADAEAYYKRIGNMVLLSASKNVEVGNKPFSEKKPTLAASAYLLTKDVGKKASWGIKEIQERQKKLAELAVQTWSLEVR